MDGAGMGGKDGAVDFAGEIDVAGDQLGGDVSVRRDGDFAGGQETVMCHGAGEVDVLDGNLAETFRAVDVSGSRRRVDGMAAVDAAVRRTSGRLFGELGKFPRLCTIGGVADHEMRSLHVSCWESVG